MSSRILLSIATALLLLASLASASASVPGTMNYQAVLTSPSGPVTTPVDVTFSIYDIDNGGTALWSEMINVSPDTNGVVAVVLGESSPLDASLFDGADRWLGVKVESDDELMPRVKFAATPYAYRIGTIDGAGGGTLFGTVTITPPSGGKASASSGELVVVGNANDTVRVAPGDSLILRATASDGAEIFVVTADTGGALMKIRDPGGGYLDVGSARMTAYDANGDPRVSIEADTSGGVITLLDPEVVKSFGLAASGARTIELSNNGVILFGDTDTDTSCHFFRNGNIFGRGKIAVGQNSTNAGFSSTVLGFDNSADGDSATVGGGHNNISEGISSTVSGGAFNKALGQFSSVGGGVLNIASDVFTTVAGGGMCIADGEGSSIGGGRFNKARGLYSTIAGGGGTTEADSNVAGGDHSSIGGGQRQIANGDHARIGGGLGDTTDASYATIAGGWGNKVSGASSIVAGGRFNAATGAQATIGGGDMNMATDDWTTIGGGNSNAASSSYATVCGGDSNSVSGSWAVVPGGRRCTAFGNYSFAAGRRAIATHAGSFVLADNSDADFTSQRVNQFRVRCNGGARFDDGVEYFQVYDDGTDLVTTSTGATLSIDGTWTNSSDRNLKENFAAIDPEQLLSKIARLNITRWNYKGGSSGQHIGPVAQDFHALFGVGADDKTISTIDPAGIALAAIQELTRRTERIEELSEQNQRLEFEIVELRSRVEELLADQ